VRDSQRIGRNHPRLVTIYFGFLQRPGRLYWHGSAKPVAFKQYWLRQRLQFKLTAKMDLSSLIEFKDPYMKVWIVLATILLVAAAPETQAQVRGGRMGGRGPAAIHSVPPAVRPGVVVNPGFQNPGFRPGFNHGFRPGFRPGFGGFPGQSIVIAPSYPYISPWNTLEPYYSSPAYVDSAPAPPSYPDPTVNDLRTQVQQLTDEVQQLQSELAARTAPPPAPEVRPSEPRPPATPMVLVFQNGRRIESQGYIVVGQMLWVVNENSPLKVPLSDLDLAATQAENLKRGINFRTP